MAFAEALRVSAIAYPAIFVVIGLFYAMIKLMGMAFPGKTE